MCSPNMNNEVEKIVPAQDLKECATCARLFTLERINTHEVICQKTSCIHRKSFDISEQRTRGTEAELLAKVAAKNECPSTAQANAPCGLSTNWRGKHEELLKKVREAKRRCSESKRKSRDLPYPPPTDTASDYVQCQYCYKTLNAGAALRHIAACASRMSETTRNFMDE